MTIFSYTSNQNIMKLLGVFDQTDPESGVGQWRCMVKAWTLEIVKLQVGYEEDKIYGVYIGAIDDFDRYGATLYFGIDGKMYYGSTEFCNERYDDGWMVVIIYGGYDIRDIASDEVLDPDQYLDRKSNLKTSYFLP